ncbi:MAG: LCP family protein [Micropruina sp.]|nr:LCP family protein [Micropruina sp.]
MGARRLRRASAGLLAATLAIAVVSITAVGSLWLSLAGIRRDPTLLPPDRPAPSSSGAVNLLLIGSDSHQPGGAASVLMLAHVDAAGRNVHLISLPCDLLVGGSDRLGGLYLQGGSAAVVVAVQQLLGITVDHVALTWLPGMSRLIDLVGGIPVDNPIAATTGRFAFPRGAITLSGEEALAFVRSDVAGAHDLDRAESQRLVLQGLVSRLLTSNALVNPGVVKAVLDQLATEVVVDSDLDARRMVELFFALRTRSGARYLQAIKLPTGTRGALPTGEAYVAPDQQRVTTLGRAIASDTLPEWERKR